MKQLFFTLLLITISTTTFAQKINTVPTKGVSDLSDGWHKFTLEGAAFDVEVLNGNLTQGNIVWFDQSTYSGKLSSKGLNGKGTYNWPNGIKYQGSFKANQRHGKGSLVLQNGSKWSGKWKNDLKNGKGKIFDANGAITKQGVWEAGKLVQKKPVK
jgi:hypothetical protein